MDRPTKASGGIFGFLSKSKKPLAEINGAQPRGQKASSTSDADINKELHQELETLKLLNIYISEMQTYIVESFNTKALGSPQSTLTKWIEKLAEQALFIDRSLAPLQEAYVLFLSQSNNTTHLATLAKSLQLYKESMIFTLGEFNDLKAEIDKFWLLKNPQVSKKIASHFEKVSTVLSGYPVVTVGKKEFFEKMLAAYIELSTIITSSKGSEGLIKEALAVISAIGADKDTHHNIDDDRVVLQEVETLSIPAATSTSITKTDSAIGSPIASKSMHDIDDDEIAEAAVDGKSVKVIKTELQMLQEKLEAKEAAERQQKEFEVQRAELEREVEAQRQEQDKAVKTKEETLKKQQQELDLQKTQLQQQEASINAAKVKSETELSAQRKDLVRQQQELNAQKLKLEQEATEAREAAELQKQELEAAKLKLATEAREAAELQKQTAEALQREQESLKKQQEEINAAKAKSETEISAQREELIRKQQELATQKLNLDQKAKEAAERQQQELKAQKLKQDTAVKAKEQALKKQQEDLDRKKAELAKQETSINAAKAKSATELSAQREALIRKQQEFERQQLQIAKEAREATERQKQELEIQKLKLEQMTDVVANENTDEMIDAFVQNETRKILRELTSPKQKLEDQKAQKSQAIKGVLQDLAKARSDYAAKSKDLLHVHEKVILRESVIKKIDKENTSCASVGNYGSNGFKRDVTGDSKFEEFKAKQTSSLDATKQALALRTDAHAAAKAKIEEILAIYKHHATERDGIQYKIDGFDLEYATAIAQLKNSFEQYIRKVQEANTAFNKSNSKALGSIGCDLEVMKKAIAIIENQKEDSTDTRLINFAQSVEQARSECKKTISTFSNILHMAVESYNKAVESIGYVEIEFQDLFKHNIADDVIGKELVDNAASVLGVSGMQCSDII